MKQYQEILDEIYQGLEPFAKGEVELNEDTELVTDLGLDSMQVMEMLLVIEDRFDISVPVSILPDVVTVRDLAQQIVKHLQDKT
jgi:acyl carrier protein